MKYKYIALNQNQQTLTGTIEAKNEQDARDQLNKLQLAILTLQNITNEENTDAIFSRYNFDATDQTGKKVTGTIAADNKLEALKRLVKEYQLNVIALYPPTATPAEQEASFNEVQSLLKQLNQLEITKQKSVAVNDEPDVTYLEQVQAKAEQIINQVNEFYKKFQNQLREEERSYIKEELIHLERIRHTENTENLERSCSKLLNYIQEKELFLESNQNIAAKTEIQLETIKLLSELKGISTQSKLGLDKSSFKRETNFIQKFLNSITGKAAHLKIIDPKLIAAKEKITEAKEEIWNYLKLLIKTKKKEYRKHAQKALVPLIRKWWRLRQEYEILSDEINRNLATTPTYSATNTTYHFSGYLLLFYLILYFAFYFLTIKDFQIKWPEFFYIHYTAIIMYIIIGIFLLHLASKVKLLMLKKQLPLTNISYVLALFCLGLIWLNL